MERKAQPLIIIAGPTATGKTELSLSLAQKFSTRGGPAFGWNGVEILAVDSMTVYRDMDIGTAKATKEEQKVVPHHLLDILDPDEEFNIAIFKPLAKKIIKKIWHKSKIPFLVGGSALYLDCLVYDYRIPEAKPDLKLRKELEQKSNKELMKQLTELDPDAVWTIDPNNKRRIIRALEVCLVTGKPFSRQKAKSKFSQKTLYLAIEVARDILYERINERVDKMMDEGFLKEVKKLYKKYDHKTSMQAAGYKELIEHIEGKITLKEAVEKTKQVHRNFAKRQLTWFKKNKDIIWLPFDPNNLEKTKQEAEKIIINFLKN